MAVPYSAEGMDDEDDTFKPEPKSAEPRNTKHVISHDYLKECVDEFVRETDAPRGLSKKCRQYRDGNQWTAEQIAALKKRGQKPIVINRIKPKLNGLLGLLATRKGDPKALPRNDGIDSKAADAVTKGLRYAADNTALQMVFMQCGDYFFCEGYCGAHITVEFNKKGEADVVVDALHWDRIFFDVHSRQHDFSDGRGKGFMMWMDREDIEQAFPDADPEALSPPTEIADEYDTFADQPNAWYAKNGKKERHMVANHYLKIKGVWHFTIYTGSGFLLPPAPSPYYDEDGEPDCAIELEHCYISGEGERYGELASSLDPQDEINHRRSKFLHLLSQRQTFGSRGAIKDVKKAKRQLARPDGHVEIGQGEFGKDFGVIPTNDMAQGQLELLNEAKQEIDAQSYNAQMSGERQSGDLSGRAIRRLQEAGVTELTMLFENLSAFKLRVYNQMWNRIRQFWDAERWVRVTDDAKTPRFVGFNVEMTMQDMLQEVMDDDSLPQNMRLGASAQMIMLEQSNPEALQQVVMVKNRPVEMDVDITLEESYDVANASQEQLDAIIQFGATAAFDVVDLLEISNIQGKDKLIERIEARRKEAATAAQQDPEMQATMAKAQDSAASAAKKTAEAQQVEVETKHLIEHGVPPIKGSMFT